MRTFIDAKKMAQTLREQLKANSTEIGNRQALEIVAKMLGFKNWHVCSASIGDFRPKECCRAAIAKELDLRDGWLLNCPEEKLNSLFLDFVPMENVYRNQEPDEYEFSGFVIHCDYENGGCTIYLEQCASGLVENISFTAERYFQNEDGTKIDLPILKDGAWLSVEIKINKSGKIKIRNIINLTGD